MLYRNKNRRASLAVVGLFVVIATVTIVSLSICQEESKPMDWQPVNWQTLDPNVVAERYPTDRAARYPSEWVTTPLEPVVVRQNHPEGPTYQEALGYTFLIYDLCYPRLARMPDGTLVLNVTHSPHVGSGEWTVVLMFSHDEGRSWSEPVEAPDRGELVSLGGQELMIYGPNTHFSQDGGKTWDEFVKAQAPEENIRWDRVGTVLAEGDEIWAISFVFDPRKGAMLHRSHDRGRTWEKHIAVPQFNGSEGAIVRAKNGDLVAALRTGFQDEGVPELSDHWRGITTYRSTDNGKTWSEPQVLCKYGYMHQKLLLLDNDDILMTYAARIGELDGRTYHGIEAVLSHDDGKTLDWQNRFIVFRWPAHQSMHSPESVQLSDGRILTVFMHPGPGRYWNDGPGATDIGHVSAVIWSAE